MYRDRKWQNSELKERLGSDATIDYQSTLEYFFSGLSEDYRDDEGKCVCTVTRAYVAWDSIDDEIVDFKLFGMKDKKNGRLYNRQREILIDCMPDVAEGRLLRKLATCIGDESLIEGCMYYYNLDDEADNRGDEDYR